MRLELTRQGDYAVRAMLALTRANDDVPPTNEIRARLLSVPRIAASEAIPLPVLPGIMRLLTRAGLVAVHRGRTGGYCLARPADRISLLEIVEAVEGHRQQRTCILRGGPCPEADQCAVHGLFVAAREAFRSSLASATLESAAAAQQAPVSGRMGPPPATRTSVRGSRAVMGLDKAHRIGVSPARANPI